MRGVIILDKPWGWSSNLAVQRVKRLWQVKVGHAGTLDPAATGMLLLFLGRATKFVQYLLNKDKTYLVAVKLGATTLSGDRETPEILGAAWQHIDWQRLERVVNRWLGKHWQTPPMYSALKRDGIPLYKLARQGKEVKREPREIFIHHLKLIDFHPPFFRLEVGCSKGTYIRSLVEDWGRELGCGAYVHELRRIAIGNLTMEKMSPWEELATKDESKVFPLEDLFLEYSVINLVGEEYHKLQQGLTIFRTEDDGIKRLYYGQIFIGLGEVKLGHLSYLTRY